MSLCGRGDERAGLKTGVARETTRAYKSAFSAELPSCRAVQPAGGLSKPQLPHF